MTVSQSGLQPQKLLLLASTSPARLATLRAAGIEPLLAKPDVDEDALLHELRSCPDAPQDAQDAAMREVQALARAKCEYVAGRLQRGEINLKGNPAVVVGCDSMLEMDGQIVGKPHTPEVARERLHAMSGTSGRLHSGHWVIDAQTGNAVGAVSTTVVHIADLDADEIEAYIATGEPLWVAGSFTIDGYGGPFITGIEGDHHGVVGISLPTLRTLLTQLGHKIPEFWTLPAE